MKRYIAHMAVLAVALMGVGAVSAQGYPEQSVKLIVPYPPGGSTDTIARLYAELMSKELGRTFVVDNRPGASTNIGSDAVVNAKADGYTVLFSSGSPTLNSVFGPKPSFDPASALEPVSLIARVPFIVAANPRAPFSSPREMVTAANAKPGVYSIASAQLNVYVELLKKQANADLLHIPYKGGAQATIDVVAGQVQMLYSLVPVVRKQIEEGKLKAIGVTSSKRLPVMPNVPTFVEMGIPYTVTTWFGLMTPAGTPAAINQRLLQATHNVVQQPAFADKLVQMGAEAVSSTPEELKRQIAEQKRTWQQLAASTPALVDAQK